MPIKKDDFEKLSPEEKLAYIQAFSMPKKDERLDFITSGWPNSKGQMLAGILGLPIERRARVIQHPIVILLLVSVFIFLQFYSEPMSLNLHWGFIPSEFYRHFCLTFITSFFLHGGWAHLFGNSYYFYIFGDDVEDQLGGYPFLLLIFGGHISGVILHSLLGGSPNIPLVGASAGISAILGYYMIQFPKRQITFMLFFFYYWVHIPAFFAFLWKFGWEFLFATKSSGNTGVAFWAHIGGALFGVLFALSRPKKK